MFAFTASTPLASSKKPTLTTSFTSSPVVGHSVARTSNGPTMILRPMTLRKPSGIESTFGGVGQLLTKADNYMADKVVWQYKRIANPMGVYDIQCTEGSVKFAAEEARVRSLNADFRASLASPFKNAYDLFENRKNAIINSHECHHEESQFCDYPQVASKYNVAKSEAYGQCFRYATPETIEEQAMLRYMDIQQNNAANPSGVYNIWCNEGAAKGQAEEIRVSALCAGFRNGQKPLGKLLQEKYDQRKAGYAACHNCSYEEDLVSRYPAIGAAFRSQTYGY